MYYVEQTIAGIKLDLSGCSLTGPDLVGNVEAVSNRSDQVELILSKNDGLGGSAAIMVSSFEANETPSEAVLEVIAH